MQGYYLKSIITGLILAVLFFVLAISIRNDVNAALGALLLTVIVLALFARSVYGSR